MHFKYWHPLFGAKWLVYSCQTPLCKKISFKSQNLTCYMERREAIIQLNKVGKSRRHIAKALKTMKVTKSTNFDTIRRYKETNSVKYRPKSGRQRSVRTQQLIYLLRMKVSRNPRRPIRQMALEAEVKHESMPRLLWRTRTWPPTTWKRGSSSVPLQLIRGCKG